MEQVTSITTMDQKTSSEPQTEEKILTLWQSDWMHLDAMEKLAFSFGPSSDPHAHHLHLQTLQTWIPTSVNQARPTQKSQLVSTSGLPVAAFVAAGVCVHRVHRVHRSRVDRRVNRVERVRWIQRCAQDWTRRDQLLEIESEMQKLWEEENAYEIDAPEESPEKYFVTFPFPYMNGKLHLGHAFSITKAEFAARFARLNGKEVLFPFGFHCTGMPIAAAALKLKECISHREKTGKDGGNGEDAEEVEELEPVDESEQTPGVFKGKKSKAVAKTGGLDQYDIMLALGISEAEIPKFTDPTYWLEYFPPLAIQDMRRFGAAVDWRRTFITTDLNPYFDSFVQWHFQKLRAKYLANGKRQTIFSTTTQQPCADHDRAEGEGVNPQEYTLIKLRVKEIPEEWKKHLGEGEVYLVAATLRPETMYGQTNCFVLPEGDYGFFRTKQGEIFVCSERSAVNMYYQDLMDGDEEKRPRSLMTKTGQDLVGLPLDAPLCQYETIHVLPMFTISMSKGTGVVTSVPAEAPDDYVCLRDWKTRSNWREQYNVKEEWCSPEVVDILTFEGEEDDEGIASAPSICEEMKIGSHREKDKLAAAKKEVYQKGFYSGIMNVGPYKGQKVADVKSQIREDLIQKGEAVAYFEPESKVVARSGDECVVALCEQWYLKYSDEAWTKRVREHVEGDFEMFSEASKNALAHAVGWLGDWACSRTFGLGTKLPWDEQWLIESLSDSSSVRKKYRLILFFHTFVRNLTYAFQFFMDFPRTLWTPSSSIYSQPTIMCSLACPKTNTLSWF